MVNFDNFRHNFVLTNTGARKEDTQNHIFRRYLCHIFEHFSSHQTQMVTLAICHPFGGAQKKYRIISLNITSWIKSDSFFCISICSMQTIGVPAKYLIILGTKESVLDVVSGSFWNAELSSKEPFQTSNSKQRPRSNLEVLTVILLGWGWSIPKPPKPLPPHIHPFTHRGL